MRTLLSAFAGIAAVVLCLLAVPGLWLDQNVVSEDGFVELAEPLASDGQFQEQLAEATARTVLENASLGPALMELARPLVDQAAQNLTENPGYRQAWEETLRGSHQVTMSGNDASAAVILDIAPIVALAAQQAADSVGADIQAPEQVLIDVGGSNQQIIIEIVQNYAQLAVPFAIAAVVAFALAMLIARRRSTTFVLVGIGVAVAAGLWKLSAEYAMRQIKTSADANELAGLFKTHLTALAEASFNEWILAGAGAAAVMILIGLISRVFAGSRT
ncbi:hypothetical protein [Arthrobacter castelli]|uniref:hypothetical protein n=1 Tax=Arthrobacter castelli TaxID=271431 RepID=UPI000407DE6B|nr:hypothetical protein [Arthrobacter castelli]